MLTGIPPIDDLFKRAEGNLGVLPGSVVIIGQDDPDDASRFILHNLIFNFAYLEKYKCIYVISDKFPLKVIQEFNKGIDNKKDMFRVLNTLSGDEKKCFEKIRDAEELSKEFSKFNYLFSWGGIPGNDSQRLIRFLSDDLNINWVDNAKIIKTDDNRTIRIFTEEKSVEIILDENMEKALLKTSDVQTYNLQVRKDNGKLNIYKDEELKKLEKFVESGNIFIVDYYSNQVRLSESEDGAISELENKGEYFRAKNFKELCKIIDIIHQNVRSCKNGDKQELVVIYNNSSIILDDLDKDKNNEENEGRNNKNDLLELFHAKDKKMTIFHLFTLSLYEEEQKNNLIDKADGFIHLKCERKKTERPLRSVGIRKMRGSRYSSAYNAFRVDEYKIVRFLE